MKKKLTIILYFIFLFSLVVPHLALSIQPPTVKQKKEIQQKIEEGNKIRDEIIKTAKKRKEAEKKGNWAEWQQGHRKITKLLKKLIPLRNEAIKLTDKYYKIDGTSALGEPKYDPYRPGAATTKRDRTVLIHEPAFEVAAYSASAFLAITKLHEFVHTDQIKKGRWRTTGKELNMCELEAYDKELKNAKKLGLSKKLIEEIKQIRKKFYDALSAENKKKVDKGNYIALVVPLKDALETGTALAKFRGKGRAAGIIFDLEIIRTTQEPFTIEIALGTPISPGFSGVQTMMVGQDMVIKLSESVTTVEVPGYCLNPELLPPPSPKHIKERQPATEWIVENLWENPKIFLGPMSIIEAGNELSQLGKFHKDMPPEKYLQTVIQRAIWYKAAPQKYNKERLHKEIVKQVEKTGGKQTPEQIEQLTNNLWEDVDLTLKESQKYRL